jgi:hypothetical protein
VAELTYRQPGLVLTAGSAGASPQQIKDLQRDLRRLGYLRAGVDGVFGNGTTLAVRALQHDLLHNDGSSRQNDGLAPVRVMDFNRGVTDVTGAADQTLVESISAMLDAADFPQLPFVDDPVAENQRILAQLRAAPPTGVPAAFLLGILIQETNLKHFHEPSGNDEDNFIVVGLDFGSNENFVVTSRGYGAGQYTLFHHPPAPQEVTDLMLNVTKNVQRAAAELRNKFDRFVNGPADTADDRLSEIGTRPLHPCKFPESDPRFFTDCRQCLQDAGAQDLVAGITPLFAGSTQTYQPTTLRRSFTAYRDVPVRKEIGCDWPYAIRRYNGGGMDSYHYQAQVLLNIKSLP